jgi:hypothetical protein
MAKELKKRIQLETLVREQMRDAEIFYMEVRPEPTFGWAPYVVADPAKVGGYQALAEEIAQQLRAKFDLKH